MIIRASSRSLDDLVVLCRREERAILVKHGASETVAWRGGQLHPQKLIDVNPRRAVLCADESRAFFLYARALRGEVVGAEVDHAHGVRLLPLHGFDDLEACPRDGVVEGEGARSGFRMPGTEQEVAVFTCKSTIPGAHKEFGRGRVASPMERATALFVGFCGTTRAHGFSLCRYSDLK